MKSISPIISRQLITLPIQRVDFGVGQSIRDPTDRFPEERRVVQLIECLRWESLHDVCFADEKGLDYCAEGEELEGGFIGCHFPVSE
jgi:hypothetical protein